MLETETEKTRIVNKPLTQNTFRRAVFCLTNNTTTVEHIRRIWHYVTLYFLYSYIRA